MNWLLLVVIILLIASALRGYQRGFIKTLFALISIIASLVVATIASPVVSKALRENEAVSNAINKQLEQVVDFNDEEEIEKTSEETSFIENLSLPESIKTTLIENNNKDVYKALAVNSFEEYVVGILSVVVINTISYVSCLLAAWIALYILSHILNLISKLPLLNEINKTTGLLAGLLSGCIKIWIFFVILTMFSTSTIGANLFEMINTSPLLSFIYDNNLLMKVITNITKSIF